MKKEDSFSSFFEKTWIYLQTFMNKKELKKFIDLDIKLINILAAYQDIGVHMEDTIESYQDMLQQVIHSDETSSEAKELASKIYKLIKEK